VFELEFCVCALTKNLTGVVVLGMPGSGCSTLLKTLSNLREEYHAVEGNVYYDSISPEDLKRHFRGDVQYIPEDDVHFPTLTVEQTLTFAAKTRTPHVRIDETREEYVKHLTDVLMTVFGLNHARNTPIGNAIIRGISGGEKKRVSITEALASRSRITAWDKSVTRHFPGYASVLNSILSEARHEASTQAQLWNLSALCDLRRTYSN
jgi:ATP-binding cassette subfamily G (WHITE) protein 2 (SNQ2)